MQEKAVPLYEAAHKAPPRARPALHRYSTDMFGQRDRSVDMIAGISNA
jgi:hypothetical protein